MYFQEWNLATELIIKVKERVDVGKWWRKPLIPTLRRLRQAGGVPEFQVNLVYRSSSRTAVLHRETVLNPLPKQTRKSKD